MKRTRLNGAGPSFFWRYERYFRTGTISIQ